MYTILSRTNIPNITFTMSMIKPDIMRYLKNQKTNCKRKDNQSNPIEMMQMLYF